jgi:DNA helicase-2/ATP-dependent DNA helicase PcrA
MEGMNSMDNLDAYQLEAVKSKHRNTLVVAPPGSGKTTVIINRIKYLIEELGVKSENIIVITFTKAAAENMKLRYLKENNSGGIPFFGTFHGLFYKILKRHLGNIDIIDSSISYKLIQKILLTKLDEVAEDKVKEVLNNISLFKTSDIELAQFQPTLDKSIFNECLKSYEEYKKEKKLLDFDDLQIKCKELLLNNPRLLKGYRKLFTHILVDEFQDCDHLQIEILKLLNRENHIFAVGDEDQSIYGFRGSKPQCMIDFNNEFKGGVKKYLTYNYRSLENIVELSRKVIDKNIGRNKKEIRAYRQGNGEVKLLNPYNEFLQVDSLLNKIEEFKQKGSKYSSNAILYRTNVEARSIIDGLIRRKIPFLLLDKEYNFFNHFICKDLISYLKLSIDPYNKESFFRVINKPFRYVSKNIIEKLKSDKYINNLFDALISNDDIHPFQMKKLEELKRDVATLNKMSLPLAIQFIITELGYLEYLREYSNRFKQSLDDLLEITEEFKSASGEFNSIINFLVHIENVEQGLKDNKNRKLQDGVILSTIHGVKGMEFNNVYIVDIVNELIPHKNNLEDIEEERRLFYVGITRAINNLYMYSPKTLRGKFKEPSPFISDENFKKISKSTDVGFVQGEKVNHKYFGEGVVSSIREDDIDIEFLDGLKRRFSISTILENNLLKKN